MIFDTRVLHEHPRIDYIDTARANLTWALFLGMRPRWKLLKGSDIGLSQDRLQKCMSRRYVEW